MDNKNKNRFINLSVGIFMLCGVIAFSIMVFKISGISSLINQPSYTVTAEFTDIGGLAVHAPVTLSGVKVGEVSNIKLQNNTLTALVSLKLIKNISIPYEDISARILTQGLLGSNYISLVAGFDNNPESDHAYLQDGDHIIKTQEAMILENLIGQLLFNIKK